MEPRWITRIALLVACATILHTIEGVCLTPFLWIRLGLANSITLLAIVLFGLREALIIASLRSLLGGIMSGIFLTPAFVLGLAGALVSAIAMSLFYRYPFGLSLVGISIIGAVTNNLIQLIIVIFIIRHIGAMVHLPFMMIVALVTGSINGFMVRYLIEYLPAEIMR